MTRRATEQEQEQESQRGVEIEAAKRKGKDNVGGYDPGEALRQEEVNVGDPQVGKVFICHDVLKIADIDDLFAVGRNLRIRNVFVVKNVQEFKVGFVLTKDQAQVQQEAKEK